MIEHHCVLNVVVLLYLVHSIWKRYGYGIIVSRKEYCDTFITFASLHLKNGNGRASLSFGKNTIMLSLCLLHSIRKSCCFCIIVLKRVLLRSHYACLTPSESVNARASLSLKKVQLCSHYACFFLSGCDNVGASLSFEKSTVMVLLCLVHSIWKRYW